MLWNVLHLKMVGMETVKACARTLAGVSRRIEICRTMAKDEGNGIAHIAALRASMLLMGQMVSSYIAKFKYQTLIITS